MDLISHLLCNDIFSGSEVEVVPDLLLTGAFAHIDATMVEWHERLAKSDDRKRLSNDLQVYGLPANSDTSYTIATVTLFGPKKNHLVLKSAA